MRYEAMGKNRTQRLNIPQLLGGLNTATDAALIEDDELSDVCNLTFDHGALVTREAVRAVGDEAVVTLSGESVHCDKITRQTIEIDGKPCTVVWSSVLKQGGNSTTETTVKAVPPDGSAVKTYSATMNSNLGHVAIAPCDRDTYGGSFLAYHRGLVLAANDTNGTITALSDEALYAPLVMVNGRSVAYKDYEPGVTAANGVMYEGFNSLTDRYRAQFTPSGGKDDPEQEIYHMPTSLNLKSFTVDITHPAGTASVTMSGNLTAEGTVEIDGTTYTIKAYSTGSFVVKPSLPVSDIAGTVTVTAYRKGSSATSLSRVSEAAWFGGTANKRGGTRLFLADAASAKLMWSDINNPFYFPENNYMYVGDTSQKITALEKQGDMLVIFKEREMFYTTYVQGEIDAEAVAEGVNVDVTASQAYFPLTQLSPQIGCRCPHSIALCRDRLVWLDSDARVYTLVVSGAYSERNVREIGAKIRPFLLDNTTESERKAASAADHKGKYRLMIGNRMVEFDYNDSGFVNVSGYSSGERAARNIAWMAHQYGFAEGAVQTLVSDGADKALIISTASISGYPIVRTLYAFDEDAISDRYLVTDGNGGFAAEEQPITTTLTTKTYEFGDPTAFKRIAAFYPMMKAEKASLYFIADGMMPSYGKVYRSDDLHAHPVLPCVHRCRTFGVRIDAEGKVCIKGLRMQYSMFGTVK